MMLILRLMSLLKAMHLTERQTFSHICIVTHLKASNHHQRQMDSLVCIPNGFKTTTSAKTNIYSVQQTGTLIAATATEIETSFRIQMIMALSKMPQYTMYWSAEFRCKCIASAMSFKKYKIIGVFFT